jgi:hypothetical protein
LCPGAPNAEHGLSDKAGQHAAEGTVFHDLVATCLEFGLEPQDFAGTDASADGFTFTIDDDMVRFARAGLDWVREHAVGAKLFIETRVDLSSILGEGEGGTADVGIVNVARRKLTVLDWKYGSGVPVSPVENEQLMLYGLGFWHSIAAELFDHDPAGVTVELVIEQPRAPGGGGVWLTTMESLLEWGADVALKAAATHDPDAPRVAGETQCKFCKARKSPEGCDAYNQHNADLIGLSFDDMDAGIEPDMPRPADLTPERRAYIVRHSATFTKWLTDVHTQVLADGLAGRPIPGLKVVSGRRPGRKWSDAEKEVAKILVGEIGETAAYVRELISPAAAEKQLTPEAYERVSRYVEWGEAKPVLAPEEDKRQALQTYAEKFGDDDLI